MALNPDFRGSDSDLPFNRFDQRTPVGVPAHSGDEAMRQLLEIVKEDKATAEQTYPIFFQAATQDRQLIANFTVPFKFNSIVLCVSGGVVAVTHGDLPPATYGPGNTPLVAVGSQYNWLFGSQGVTPGSVSGANAQPISLFTGPQEIRFRVREAGQKITLWVHPDSYMALRASIDPTYAKLNIVGAVEFLK